MGKRKLMTDEEKDEEAAYLKKEVPHGVPKHQTDQQKRLIVILERANLEVIKVSFCCNLFIVYIFIIIFFIYNIFSSTIS